MSDREAGWRAVHGHHGDKKWARPHMAVRCDDACRADQGNATPSHEYLDAPDVLEAKMQVIAEMIRAARCCVAYTGAGLSRAAGIADYATKSKNSVSGNAAPKLDSPLEAEPTFAHRVLAALERRGMLHEYVQQNHDGLPQKAGFPQEKINEIHGAWYDPSNPVVQFSGSLRSDLFQWMLDIEQRADLCLCLGTSLSGMNADRIAETPSKKMRRGVDGAFGTVIINLQETPLDHQCAVRVWARLDDAFEILARILALDTALHAPPDVPAVVTVPYNEHGMLDLRCRMKWDLRKGAKIKVVHADASNRGEDGHIVSREANGDCLTRVGFHHRVFGRWWVLSAMRGASPYIPFVNESPRVKRVRDEYVCPPEWARAPAALDVASEEGGAAVPAAVSVDAAAATSAAAADQEELRIVQTHERLDSGHHLWEVRLEGAGSERVREVRWRLHPTFSPAEAVIRSAPFAIRRTGWGTFDVEAEIGMDGGGVVRATHPLSFAGPLCCTDVRT